MEIINSFDVESINPVAEGITGILIQPKKIEIAIGEPIRIGIGERKQFETINEDGTVAKRTYYFEEYKLVRPVRTIVIERLVTTGVIVAEGEEELVNGFNSYSNYKDLTPDDYRLSSRVHFMPIEVFENAFEIDHATLKPVIKKAVIEEMFKPFNLKLL